ncbi:universal stress protein [Pseudoruegeria sp. HB172150]|uniref:universal stress protein n=1 Tax=Pseudoruegeria sp. HB172150 TaxID=2721164 RepID=UPI001554D1A7|nr:universal stress protein [Pseudoruegeria sp. HB172150]
MFQKIMVPVDLAHLQKLAKALDCAAELAKHYGAELCYVGVTGETPGPLGHNPTEYEAKLKAFTEEHSDTSGLTVSHLTIPSHDPTVDVDDALLKAVKDTGADLVVMGTHEPGIIDYIWPGNGAKIAAHSAASVFLVRDS